MRIIFFFFLIFISTHCYTQKTTYTSLATEYFIEPKPAIAPMEWLKRDIRINGDTISLISYGAAATEIQRWIIQTKKQTYETNSSNIVYYTHLASGYDREYPAVFIVYKNKDEKVEVIDCQQKLPNGSQSVIRFHID